MRRLFAVTCLTCWILVAALGTGLPPQNPARPIDVDWMHGSPDCGKNADPAVQVFRYDDRTWILRQNKCLNFEAPFIYLLLGDERAFMQDTGAVPDSDGVRVAVDRILAEHGAGLELLVTHSHGHRDHVAGDPQFEGRPNTTIAAGDVAGVREMFGITDWPNQAVELDLGGRILDVIPIPGHQDSHVAVYDRRTAILLTGDTLYPGRLYVRDWAAYRTSISRLVAFTRTRRISWVLGTHVEMSTEPGIDYPVRTTYQPSERPLQLRLAHLIELGQALDAIGDEPQRDVHDAFIIFPLD